MLFKHQSNHSPRSAFTCWKIAISVRMKLEFVYMALVLLAETEPVAMLRQHSIHRLHADAFRIKGTNINVNHNKMIHKSKRIYRFNEIWFSVAGIELLSTAVRSLFIRVLLSLSFLLSVALLQLSLHFFWGGRSHFYEWIAIRELWRSNIIL